jgi:two-component system sensor histidine kinase KdpD
MIAISAFGQCLGFQHKHKNRIKMRAACDLFARARARMSSNTHQFVARRKDMNSAPTLVIRGAWLVRAYNRLTDAIARLGWPMRYGLALFSTALVTAVMALSGLALEPANISLIYLLAVLFTATTAGVGAGVLASVLSFLAYNFFFVQPLYVFTVANPQDVVRLISFLIAALLASSLAGLVHLQAEQLGQRAAELESLYALSQATSAAVDLDHILPAIAATTVDLLQVAHCTLTVQTQAASRVFQAPLMRVDTTDGPNAIVAPLRVNDRVLGEMQVLSRPEQVLHSPQRQLLATLASQAALAVERARLVAEATEAQALAASDRLKSALLSSVSHDLRTPLVAVKGIATALRQHDVPWNSAVGEQMLDTLADEADRLNRLVGNLLDMSRIEGGALNPARQWEDIGDIVGGVLAHMRSQLHGRKLGVNIPADLPLVWVSAALIDQVLTNLIENALKYTPDRIPVTISAEVRDADLWISVADQGPGITAEALPHIFDKFFRVIGPERHAEGTGLGLAICKGIVEAHGGTIWAENQPTGGARFVFTLPLRAADDPHELTRWSIDAQEDGR